MAEKPLKFLTTTNDWLEEVPLNTINAFNNMIGTGEKVAQSKVDMICAWLAWKVNIAIERKRQALLKTLHDQYMSNQKGPVMRAATAISSFVSDPLGAIGDFAGSIFSPVTKVFEWIKVLLKEIPRLAANLARIVSALPPDPPNPNINYDKFKLKVGSIGLNAIIKGTAGMKSPEEMFPEPPKPFSKESFDSNFTSTSIFLKTSLIKYKLKPGDFESMNEAIRKEAGEDLLNNATLDSFKSVSSSGDLGGFDSLSGDNPIV